MIPTDALPDEVVFRDIAPAAVMIVMTPTRSIVIYPLERASE